MKKLGFFCLLFMIALSACRDNIDEVNTTEEPFVPPIVNWTPQTKPVDGSVTGFVTDKANEPVAGATVKMGNLTTTTDDYGHFFFDDATLNAKGTYLTVEKAGYFPGSRRFAAVENQTNRVKVEILEKSFDYSFNAADGGTIQTPSGAVVTFSPNTIKYETGAAYTGEVKVAAAWLDPSSLQTLDQMPGSLQGVNSEGNEVVLGTYGMVAVELVSNAGEALNISEGNTATLSMPVPSSLQGAAPSEIPLWSFNEEHGIWVEESTATLNNGVYTGEVAHFSFWNADYPYDVIDFTAQFVDDNGTPLYNYLVSVKVAGTSFSGSGYTSPNGTVNGFIPVNENLVLTVHDICGDVVYTENIGPFSNNTDLGSITVDNSSLIQTTVTGELVDCTGAAIQNGLVTVQFGGKTVYDYVTGGTFSTTFGACATTTEMNVLGVDLDALIQSDPVTVTNTGGTHNVGQISVCDVQLQNFISVSVNDGTNTQTAVYTPALISVDSTVTGLATFINYYSNNPTEFKGISFFAEGSLAGDYSNSNSVDLLQDEAMYWDFGEAQTFDSFEITEYGGWGEPIIGTFEGSLINYGVQPPANVTVSGTFNILNQ